jgi:hypothetical protein
MSINNISGDLHQQIGNENVLISITDRDTGIANTTGAYNKY